MCVCECVLAFVYEKKNLLCAHNCFLRLNERTIFLYFFFPCIQLILLLIIDVYMHRFPWVKIPFPLSLSQRVHKIKQERISTYNIFYNKTIKFIRFSYNAYDFIWGCGWVVGIHFIYTHTKNTCTDFVATTQRIYVHLIEYKVRYVLRWHDAGCMHVQVLFALIVRAAFSSLGRGVASHCNTKKKKNENDIFAPQLKCAYFLSRFVVCAHKIKI